MKFIKPSSILNKIRTTDQSFNIFLLFLIIIAVGSALRFSSIKFKYTHPDEIITISVSENILKTGAWDTNWKLAPLPKEFKYAQYNFSGYIMSSALILKVVSGIKKNSSFDSLAILRLYSSILGVIVVTLIFLLSRQLYDSITGLFAASIASITPLLYQDSLYARPETFVTALTLLFVYILGKENVRVTYKILLSSIVLGFLIATKFSLIAFAPVAVLQIVEKPNQGLHIYILDAINNVIKYFPLITFGCTVGFVIGAPYAVVNFADYINGIFALNRQYTTGHWPHGLIDGSLFSRLFYSYDYFIGTLGYPLFMVTFVGCVLTFANKNWRAFFIIVFALIPSVRFSSYPVFFERNFSHLLPFFIIAAGYGINKTLILLGWMKLRFLVAGILLIIVLIVPGLTSAKIRFEELPGIQRERVSKMRSSLESKYMPVIQIGFANYYKKVSELTKLCEPLLFQFIDFGDDNSKLLLQQLKLNNGFKEVGRVNSLFNGPTSTLNTYFTPTTVFLYKGYFNESDCLNKHN